MKKTIVVITAPAWRNDDLDLFPYDICDIHKGETYNDEAHFRSQDWVKLMEPVRVYDLQMFIEACNDDWFVQGDYWYGYFYFREYDEEQSQNKDYPANGQEHEIIVDLFSSRQEKADNLLLRTYSHNVKNSQSPGKTRLSFME